jgi:hypothetical protein
MSRGSVADADAHDAVHAALGALVVVVCCLAVAATWTLEPGGASFGVLSFAPLAVAVALAVAPRVPSRVLAGMLVGTPALVILEGLDDRTLLSELVPAGLASAAVLLPGVAFVLGLDGLLAPFRSGAARRGHGARVALTLTLAALSFVGVAGRAWMEGLEPGARWRLAAIVFTSVASIALARRGSSLRAWVARAELAVAAASVARTRRGVLVRLDGAPVARELVLVEPVEGAAEYRADPRARSRRWISTVTLREIEDRARRLEWLALFALVWLGLPALT